MKKLIFVLILTCLALNAQAQVPQQIDSTPSPSLWVRANTPVKGSVGTLFISPDTSWAVNYDSNDVPALLLSIDGGLNWQIVPAPKGQPAFRTKSDGYIFGAYTYRTLNGGKTWDSVGLAPPYIGSYAIVDSLHAFTAGLEITRTTDGGKTWTVSDVPMGGNIGFANSMVGYAVGPVIQGPQPWQKGAGCIKTVDGGNTWNQIYTGIPYDAEAIAVINPSTADVACSHIIVRTTDGGISWTRTPVPDTTVAYWGITINGAEGYATASHGIILHTFDTGKTWAQEPSGLTSEYLYNPVMYEDSIAAVADDNGIILIRKPGNAGVSNLSQDSLPMIVFPNPAQNQITFQYNLPSSQSVTLTAFDVTGHLIATVLQSSPENPGAQSIPMSTANLASGTYLYQFSSENYSSSGTFTIVK